ncbi:Phosphoribosylglycinamide formyltransferase [hydrothermal vent metagenome]|uniref:phosphoribosylglycinamide formyltransferase 1 n=1 Tax=hydrothermal vent metagenome TaxID=652676 RepID=A0A1W1CSB3_9ZZZZ
MHKLAVLFSGQGTNFAYLLNTLHGQGFEIVVAITNNPLAGGIAIAKNHNIPLEIIHATEYKNREDFDKELVAVLEKYQANLTILAGFMRILSPIFTTKIHAINLHPSLLPKHKGLHAIEKSYADDSDRGGVSVHYVNETLDGGKIIVQKSIAKKALSFEDYDSKIRSIEKIALKEAIKKIFEERR